MKRIGMWLVCCLAGSTSFAAAAKLPINEGAYAPSAAICAEKFPEKKIVIMWVNNGLSIKPYYEHGGVCRIEKYNKSGDIFKGRGFCIIKGIGETDDYVFSYKILNRNSFVSEGKTYKNCKN